MVRAVLKVPPAQPCWAQANQGTAVQAFQSVKHQVIKNKTPFQQPFYLSRFRSWARAEPHQRGTAPALICASGRKENRRITFDSEEMVNESRVQWLLITLLSGNAAAENNRPNDSFSDSLLATQLSKEPNGMADYRLPVIYETVTIIVAEKKLFE